MVTNALCLKLQFFGFWGSSFESILFFHGSSLAGIVLKDRLMMAPGYCARCHGGITWRSKLELTLPRQNRDNDSAFSTFPAKQWYQYAPGGPRMLNGHIWCSA